MALMALMALMLLLVPRRWNPAVEQQAQDRIHRLGQVGRCAELN